MLYNSGNYLIRWTKHALQFWDVEEPKDQKLSLEELKKIKLDPLDPGLQPEQELKDHDKDKDNKLNLDEFIDSSLARFLFEYPMQNFQNLVLDS